MEAIACSNPFSFRISSTINSSRYNELPKTHLYLFPSFSSTFPRNFIFPRKSLHFDRFISASLSSVSSPQSQNPSPDLAVLLEVEGILMDVYRTGNRQAFNLAFQKLGLDCANWTEPIYLDLVKKSSGDEERMVMLYFNRIGWPASLPTSEKEAFMRSVLREKKSALDEYVISKNLPFRPGVEDICTFSFIGNAHNEGIPVVILTTYSKTGEKTARSIVEKLSPEIISKVKIIGEEEVKQSLYGQLMAGVPSGLDEQLAKEAMKAASTEKQRIAEEVASILKLSVDIDTKATESLPKIVAALHAGAEFAGVPFRNCVLVAGSQSGVAGAERIGMPCVVVRSSLTSRAEFPSAKATLDGFGGTDLTIAKLLNKRW